MLLPDNVVECLRPKPLGQRRIAHSGAVANRRRGIVGEEVGHLTSAIGRAKKSCTGPLVVHHPKIYLRTIKKE